MTGLLEPVHRSGHAAIAGAPNTGKSTLLNALVGTKLSIISRRPQTTRQNVVGILTRVEAQIILVDTPGLLDPVYRLHNAMIGHARSAIAGADMLLLLLDAEVWARKDPSPALMPALEAAGGERPVVLALNKVDRFSRPMLLPLLDRCRDLHDWRALVPISALKRDGLDRLLEEIVSCLPEGPVLFPEDIISDRPEAFFVAELVREAVFERFGQEVPYATVTRVEEFRRGGGGKAYARVILFVERESQKAILVGKGGRGIKGIGAHARRGIEEFLEEPVYLDLQVRVLEEWRRRESRLRELDLL